GDRLASPAAHDNGKPEVGYRGKQMRKMGMQPGVAWIVGGGSGIGAAVAKCLAKGGWAVAISGRRADKLADVAATGSAIRPYPLDVTDSDGVAETVAAIVSDLGRIDLFIFGAATWQPMAPGDYDFEKFFRIVDANYLGLV